MKRKRKFRNQEIFTNTFLVWQANARLSQKYNLNSSFIFTATEKEPTKYSLVHISTKQKKYILNCSNTCIIFTCEPPSIINRLNPLPDDKILPLSKLKSFADD